MIDFMNLTTDQHMYAFLSQYLAFAETEENPLGFGKSNGLCVAKFQYIGHHVSDDEDFILRLAGDMEVMLEELFERSGIPRGTWFPFGKEEYSIRFKARTQHKCPIRQAFIRNYLSQSKLEQA